MCLIIVLINIECDDMISKTCKDRKQYNNGFLKLCSVCSKKSRFIKDQEANGLLTSLVKKHCRKILLVGPVLF